MKTNVTFIAVTQCLLHPVGGKTATPPFLILIHSHTEKCTKISHWTFLTAHILDPESIAYNFIASWISIKLSIHDIKNIN